MHEFIVTFLCHFLSCLQIKNIYTDIINGLLYHICETNQCLSCTKKSLVHEYDSFPIINIILEGNVKKICDVSHLIFKSMGAQNRDKNCFSLTCNRQIQTHELFSTIHDKLPQIFFVSVKRFIPLPLFRDYIIYPGDINFE